MERQNGVIYPDDPNIDELLNDDPFIDEPLGDEPVIEELFKDPITFRDIMIETFNKMPIWNDIDNREYMKCNKCRWNGVISVYEDTCPMANCTGNIEPDPNTKKKRYEDALDTWCKELFATIEIFKEQRGME